MAFERECTLWVHDPSFSTEHVVINLSLFDSVLPGDLLTILPLTVESSLQDLPEVPSSTEWTHENQQYCAKLNTKISRNTSSLSIMDQSLNSENRCLFVAKSISGGIKSGLEISISRHIAEIFSLKHRSNVIVSRANVQNSTASHVELSFKDEYLTRTDMWNMAISELFNKAVYKGQKILFMGSIKAQVIAIHLNGQKVKSAFFSSSSMPIFRSGSAHYSLFIQMSREMWDFDSEGSGEIMFNKVINGFFPTLFKKWAALRFEHLVSIVLFARVEYETGITSGLVTDAYGDAYFTGFQSRGSRRPYKDFYRVAIYEMASGSWTMILYQLKREFKFFRRDISMHHIKIMTSTSVIAPESSGDLGSHFEAHPSLAMYGNVLEAIDLACCQFEHEHIDQDLMRTGNSIVIITPCAGLFEVDYETLRKTTEMLISYGISIDMVCLPRMPLHSAPLFRYRNPEHVSFMEGLRLRTILGEDGTSTNHGEFTNSFSTQGNSLSPLKSSRNNQYTRGESHTSSKLPDKWLYAIPHWLNISFWTGPSKDAKSPGFLAQLRTIDYGGPTQNRACDFAVRCKMYEMEMAGIVESVLTEISVVPLHHDPLFPQTRTGISSNQPNLIHRRVVYNSFSEINNRQLKCIHPRKSQDEGKFLQHLFDTYDHLKSQISGERHSSRQKDAIKRSLRYSDGQSPRNRLIESGSLCTSLGNQNAHDKRATSNSRYSLPKDKNRHLSSTGSSDAVVVEKNCLKNNINLNAKDFRSLLASSRQISLGKYGFGVAAPIAVAAEIHVENAKAIRPSSGTNGSKGIGIKSKTLHFPNDKLPTPSLINSKRQLSLGEKPKKEVLAMSPDPKSDLASRDKASVCPERPMTVKSALESLDSTNQVKTRSVLDSLYGFTDQKCEPQIAGNLQSDSKLVIGSNLRPSMRYSPNSTLSPWLTFLNPSNSNVEDLGSPGQYRRCRPVFANARILKAVNWKSLCSPASVPLTTENFPTKNQLDTQYQQKPYNISQNVEDELSSETIRSREVLLRELVGLRFSQGFQMVVGSLVAEAFGQKALKAANIFELNRIAEEGGSIVMSMGRIIHQISCVNDGEFEINIFVRKPSKSNIPPQGRVYQPAIRTKLSNQYKSQSVILGKSKNHYNWNYVDAFIGGFYDEISDTLCFHRVRFVLIPVNKPSLTRKCLGEDSDEEVRLEGIKKLTQMWQRYRVVPASERTTQNFSNRNKDPNPLDIVYKTDDPSVVVTAELETLPLIETGENGLRKSNLFGTERFRRSKLDIGALVEAIQEPVEKGGVRMQNRRWHLRLHHNCFIGSDMTTWLIDNFEDIETREKAVEFGNKLMVKGEITKGKERETGKEREKDTCIFVHVEGRHIFRDGQYFYQITGDHAKQGLENRSGWFSSRKHDLSVSSFLTGDIQKEPPGTELSQSYSSFDDKPSCQCPTTLNISSGFRKPKVILSKVMSYDVDHRRRSSRPEIINLHYDRLHNPDNCYHIRIDWLSVTTRLIKDAIESWAIIADRYGLRLVEVPLAEACTINSVNPFRNPYRIELVVPPPDQAPSIIPACRHEYQKSILKKFNFVLDTEAATNFPRNVEISFSWGKSDYQFTQYIHRSGVLLAQVTDSDCFLLLTNRYYYNRTVLSREESLANSRHVDLSTPQSIRDELEMFCSNAETLVNFYKEVNDRRLTQEISPHFYSNNTCSMDDSEEYKEKEDLSHALYDDATFIHISNNST
ncbi:Vacuolar membrane-associated protein iml1 [Golovinomyces cichoracearum]|uniref:Vacuolar membrane-associated protein IML1 n=1 Tax=Golovinomyces cichoracearum TaxID=62708 RepID=A0A420HI90_9PEZI|nr:Vacuolar membrane-associated protein iml1 [Golovinomyces cichoracearum]